MLTIERGNILCGSAELDEDLGSERSATIGPVWSKQASRKRMLLQCQNQTQNKSERGRNYDR